MSSARRLAVIVSVVATAVLGAVSPAAAGVVVDPAESTQGAAVRLTFRILNDSPTASIVKVDMLLPAEAPIADVYPLSVDDWAPAMTMRTLSTPLQSLHGPLITEAVASVTWTAVDGRALPPGKSTELYLSVGPLPEVERLVIGVVVTDSAGTVVRAAPVMVLKPEAAPPPVVQEQSPESTGGDYLPWTLAILAAVALLTMWGLWAQRRRSAKELETETTHTPDRAALVHH